MQYADNTLRLSVKPYQIVGRAKPSSANPSPTLFKMVIYAKNEIVARSRFWYFLKSMKKIKHSKGELVQCVEVKDELEQNCENYGVWARFDSRTGTHNVYKEFRDVSKSGAVGQCMQALNGNHRAKTSSIQIIGVIKIEDTETIRNKQIQKLNEDGIKFPLIKVKTMSPRSERKKFTISSKA